jgi:SAM-dependent methyltransferase
VGLDYSNPLAPLLGDAHVLPFQDESFELVVSLAVLEHLQHPALAMSEARRVLKPGGVLIGTVAFLEPFHSSSYYHHTHLGAMNSLRAGGFQVELVAPSSSWTVLRAHARKSLFPRMPARAANTLVWPLLALHRLWWAAAGLRSRRSLESTRLRLTAGSYSFVARRPLLSDRA